MTKKCFATIVAADPVVTAGPFFLPCIDCEDCMSFTACSDYALSEHVKGRTFRIVRLGSAREMRSARRAAKRDCPDKKYCVFLTVSKGIGDFVR